MTRLNNNFYTVELRGGCFVRLCRIIFLTFLSIIRSFLNCLFTRRKTQIFLIAKFVIFFEKAIAYFEVFCYNRYIILFYLKGDDIRIYL